MTKVAKLPIIDLSSPDRVSTANLIRQACIDYGFFYLVNHGVERELIATVFNESRKFFALPLDDKMSLFRKEHRGYTPIYQEKLDPSANHKGDLKESFYIGPLTESKAHLNQWPHEGMDELPFVETPDVLPSWRCTMETYREKVMAAGKRLISLIALALELDEDYFEKIGALDSSESYLRLLHYPVSDETNLDDEPIWASAHSDYGMITLLATEGVPGLQVCREKFKQPQIWEDVPDINGAFIVNIGDMTERWTNNLFRSTLHRVTLSGQERYSLAFFLDPNPDCIVECIESCISESCPKRFPPIRSGDYMKERFSVTYGGA